MSCLMDECATPSSLETLISDTCLNALKWSRTLRAHACFDWSVTLAPDLHGSTRGRRNNDLQLSFNPPTAPPRHTGCPPFTPRQRQRSSQTNSSGTIWRGAMRTVWDYRYSPHPTPIRTEMYIYTIYASTWASILIIKAASTEEHNICTYMYTRPQASCYSEPDNDSSLKYQHYWFASTREEGGNVVLILSKSSADMASQALLGTRAPKRLKNQIS